MGTILSGSICLSDIPREMMKKVQLKDGREKVYVNIAVFERQHTSPFGHTHNISCAPKKEERKDGVNYYIGDLKKIGQAAPPTSDEIENAPQATNDDFFLPF